MDINLKDNNGRTLLSLTIKNKLNAVVKLLLKTRKIDVNSKAFNSQTPLSLAARNGHKAIVKRLLETGKADVDLKNYYDYGRTPLS
jgi:ankyrin repeat protein